MKLGVNIDHVATLRQARRGIEPEPITAAQIAELAGADSIVCHLREDRRHIQDRDLFLLKEVVHSRLNLEMGMSDEIIQIAMKAKPEQVTLVPERREEITTEGGLNVIREKEKIKSLIKEFHSNNIEVSLFIDPDKEQVQQAKVVGADIVEIHTGQYSNAKNEPLRQKEFFKIYESAIIASNLRLYVAAGHGLNYRNVQEICKIIEIKELNIGHSIISRAVFVGLFDAVKEMKEIISRRR